MSDNCRRSNIVSEHCEDIQHILIIEDSLMLASNLKSHLEEKNGVICDNVVNESQAKKLLKKNNYDLIIVDIFLPDSSENFIGWLIRHHLKIFIMTGSSNDDVREKLVKLPIVDYLLKTDEKALFAYISETIDRLQSNKNALVAVCDDSKLARRYITTLLKNQNIPFIELENGKEVLECLSEYHLNINLLISDYEMPDMDGLELTRKLRKQYTHLELPILILSGKNSNSDIANILKAGANEYVHKPLSHEEFLIRMNRLIDHSRLYFQNEELTKKLLNAAMHDNLTGLFNRHYFDSHFKQVFSLTQREKQQYAIILLDIDHFKLCNDNYGHDAGDMVLKEVASVMVKTARGVDIVCRWGGEEFIILLPNINPIDAMSIAERIRSNIQRLKLTVPSEENPISITISGGVSISDSQDIQSVIKDADEKLYIAKDSGRNKMVLTK